MKYTTQVGLRMDKIKKASLFTAIKTPYSPDGKIDLDGYDSLVERQIESGVEGLIIGGTTGEGHLMDWEEHISLISHSVSRYGSKLVIVGNTGSNNTREAIYATRQGFEKGMDVALQINPYYGKTSEQGLLRHFDAVLPLGPAMIYNVPGRTGQDIVPAIMEKVAQHENFLGVKECGGNERIREYEGKGIACWSGNDDQAYGARHESNAHGVVSVTSNLVPGLMRKLMDNPDAGLNQQLQPLFSWLFCEPNPIPINTALSMTGAIQPVFRLPYVPLSVEKRREGLAILSQLGLENLVGNKLQELEDSHFIFPV